MLKGFAADLFFPGRCAVCDEVLSSPKDGICSECRKLLQYIEEPRCMKCGKGLMSSEQEYCYDCGKEERSYICGFPLLNYVSPVRESLARMKYDGRQEYAEFYGRELAMHFKDSFGRLGIAALVPVPVSSKRRRERGYNQAEMIARGMGRIMHRPVMNLLIKKDTGTSQTKLSQKARKENTIGKYEANIPQDWRGKRILLVDDVLTTGATIGNCAQAILATDSQATISIFTIALDA